MKRVLYFLMISTWWIGTECFAQSPDQNYILTRTMQNAEGTQSIDKIDYFDGLGRPVQTVMKKFTSTGKDLVTLQEYDGVGRKAATWLPVPLTTNTGAYVNANELTQRAKNYYGDQKPYVQPIYESSPLNRIEQHFGAGEAWHTAGKSVKTDWMTNDNSPTLQCSNYQVLANHSLTNKGAYANNQLYVTQITDEDGNVSYTFTDKLEKTVLTRQINRGVNHDTYYVYDDFGNLRYVLPPLAADALTATNTSWNTGNNEAIKNYAYYYRYDGRNNCIEKKLPGCEPIYMKYDKADRLIFSQDGNQRTKNRWMFLLYDVFGRQTVSGVWKSGSVPTVDDMVVKTDYTGSGALAGYTVNLSSLPNVDLMTVNFYDTYTFITDSELNYVVNTDYGTKWESAKGLLTGTRTYQLSSPAQYTVAAMYYDDRGNVVQTRTSNHMGGYDIAYNKYDFTGKTLQTRKEHNIAGNALIIELYEYIYDHAGRLISTSSYDSENRPICLAYSIYDELGRLIGKRRHNGANIEAYNYNLRGWVTNIKSGEFEENIRYNTNMPSSARPYYNGNIAYTSWKYNGAPKGYDYTYDALNRLKKSICYENNTRLEDIEFYSENFNYDKHGNITHLARWSNEDVIDMLSMNYNNSNQLRAVNDNGISTNTYGTKEYQNKANTQQEFLYDANGNMTTDLDRGIVTIRYNVLNLPDTIQFATGDQLINHYDAAGNKLGLRNVVLVDKLAQPLTAGRVAPLSASDNVYISGMEYIDNIEYLSEQISPTEEIYTSNKIHNSEGFLSIRGYPRYAYYARDHLGNIREVWRAGVPGSYYTSSVVQRTQYYPSGLPWAEGLNTDYQNHKYNGKEFIEMHGYDTYDYGARGMYPAIMRFTTIDPLAEKYYSVSPYAYCVNNPVLYIDPFGMDYWSTNDPDEIRRFFYTINFNSGRNSFEKFNFSSWNHVTDAEFTENLTYNDETKTFHSSYGTVENGEFVKVGVSIKASGGYDGSASIPNYSAIDWWQKSSGRITPVYPEFDILTLARAVFNISTRAITNYGAKSLGSAAKGFTKNNIPKGFKEVKRFGYPHGQKVYKYMGKYYSQDIDSHSGGVWKVFKEVNGKLKRIGTTDKYLTIFTK